MHAARYVSDRKLSGPVFNAFRDGGYLELVVPQVAWLQDARVQAHPADFFAAEQEAEKSPESFRAWLRQLGAEWALTTRVKERLGGYELLHGAPEWALVYWDAASEVWVRRDVDRFAALLERDEFRHFRPFGPVLEQVASAPITDMKAWTLELDRYEAAAPGDRTSSLVRCAVVSRGGGPDTACRYAASLDPSSRWQALVAKAASIPQAAP